MVFSSLIFCTIFLPICLLLYYGLPRLFGTDGGGRIALSNYILLAFSLIFYAFGGYRYLFLIAAVIFFNWGFAFLCSPERHDRDVNKISLVGIVIIDLGTLFFFKYFNLFIAIIENIFFGGSLGTYERFVNVFEGNGTGALGLSEIVLPVGISFFTFQALSYVVDVYKGDAGLQTNIFTFALYISCFPQLIAGPIVHYKDVSEQLVDRTVGSYEFVAGIKRFCFGLGKKVVIANTLALTVDKIWAADISSLDAATAWLGSIAYTMQIYYDFSGYSDMAIGLGKMFGFDFKENFDHPYRSESVRDFWRRWHISLSTWFRDYVYIPLGGSCGGLPKTCLNLFIVFLLTGIWHGANFTFLVWGLSYGVLLIFERVWFGRILDKNPVKYLNRLLTFFIVNLLWVVFRADNIFVAFTYISRMFTGGIRWLGLLSYLNGMTIIALIFALFFAGFVQAHMSVKAVKGNMAVCLAILAISLLFMVNGTYNPFIYYQF